METTTSQRSTLFKGLRLKSSTGQRQEQEQVYPLRQTSPLRSNLAGGASLIVAEPFSEQVPVESQREALRRELQQKEAALDRIHESKERLRMRIGNTLGIGMNANQSTQNNHRQNTLANSISQTSIYGQDFYTTNQIQKRDITPTSREINRKSASPLRQLNKTIHSTFDLTSQQKSTEQQVNSNTIAHRQSVIQPAQSTTRLQYESVQSLQADNSQLQRRLNLVVAELDRMNREKSQQQQNLGALSQETEYYMQALDEEQQTDKSAEILHEEIFVSREENKKVQLNILQVDRQRQEAITQLRLLQSERERRVQNCEDLTSGVQNKITIMKDIEREIIHLKERIERINGQLKAMERKLKDDGRSNSDIEVIVNRLQSERDDLQQKLCQLNENYNNAVAELSRERHQLEAQNKRHMQLLSNKNIFLLFTQMIADRKQIALNEIVTYCKFDTNCHRSLNRFSNILQQCGHHQMRIGLKKWFQNSLKPLQTRRQGYQLNDKLYAQKLKTRMFRRWLDAKLSKRNTQTGKGRAAFLVCKIQIKWNDMDIFRFFLKWRNIAKLDHQRGHRLRAIIARQFNSRRKQCFEQWLSECSHINEQMRFHILAKEFAAKQLMLIAYTKFHKNTSARRGSRLMKLGHILKAWKDGVAYRKYMMGQNVSTSHLRRQLNKRLLESCFNYLRIHKEDQKREVVCQNLGAVCDPAIQQLTADIQEIAVNTLQQRKSRSLACLSFHVMTSLQSYFAHWKNVKEMTEHKIQKNLRERVTSLYRNQLHRAFNLWSRGSQLQKITNHNTAIQELQSENTVLSSEIGLLKQVIGTEHGRIEKNSRIRLNRACEIWKRRVYQNFLSKWSVKSRSMNSMESSTDFVIQKTRNGLCKQAFEIYKNKVRMCRQEDLDEQRAAFYIQTRALRKLRQIYNAFCQYHASYSRQKINIRIALKNIDIYLQRKAYFKWMDQGHLKREQLLRESQNNQTLSFDGFNKDLGMLTTQHNDSLLNNTQLMSGLKAQAQRVLANTFQRYYYIKAQRGIQKWLEVIQHQKHLEGLLKRQIQHTEKQMFYYVKAAFQNWICQSKIKETKAEIIQTQFKISDSNTQTEFNQQTHVQLAEQLAQEIQIITQKTEAKSSSYSWSINQIIQKNDKWNYQSRLRFIFTNWASFTKRQRNFCKAIEKVISKSMFQDGFTNINAHSREQNLARHQNACIKQLRRMFWTKNCGKVIALWNTKSHENLTSTITETVIEVEDRTQKHFVKIEEIKEQNCSKGVASMLGQKQKKNLLQSWRNAVLWQKKLRLKNQKLEETAKNYQIHQALKKWHLRSEKTATTRNLVNKFQIRLTLLKTQSVFTAMVSHFKSQMNFILTLSNVAAKFDHRMKLSVVQMMASFAHSRRKINLMEKKVSASNIGHCLQQLYLRRMTSNLACLRSQMMVQKRKDAKIGNMIGHWFSQQLRNIFMRWKNNAHLATTVIEVNETGPVVEEVLNQKLQYTNYISFMKEQAFTPKEIDQVVVLAEGRSKELLSRSVARIKHHTNEGNLYLKPIVFDRWREYVKMRKLLKYILRNMENKLKPVSADLSISFNRWKHATGCMQQLNKKHQEHLNGVDRGILIKRCANNTDRLNDLQGLVDQGDTFTGLMSVQRDELVDNYIKSQRLAIALGRDNLERGMTRAMDTMATHAHISKRSDFEHLLERNINLIASLKERIQDFENDNVSLANENEELRQFSLDGYQIAKNVQSLSNERERLSVDLADKATALKKLLSENELLSHSLRQAQEHAVVLVQQSNNNMRRMQQQPVDYY